MNHANAKRSSSAIDAWIGGIVSVALFLMLVVLACWPLSKVLFGLDHEALTVRPLGAVLKVHYVDGFTTHTQVDTLEGTFLLAGSKPFPTMAKVELREKGSKLEMCLESKDFCWRVIRH